MIIYFSGAKNYLSDQRDINQSLGGYMSSTPIPNGRLNAIFDDLSEYKKNVDFKQVLAIFIHNDSENNITNLTIENFYQRMFAEKTNLCDFEFSVIEPTNDGFIELIGNKNEEPYYVDWFSCESVKEFCKFKVTTPGNIGEQISILGNNVTLQQISTEHSTEMVYQAAKLNTDFVVERNGLEIIITRKSKEILNNDIQFSTNGLMTLTNQNFLNGLNGKVLIADILEKQKSLGLWIKRKINNENLLKLKSNSCDIENKLKSIKKELIEIEFDFV